MTTFQQAQLDDMAAIDKVVDINKEDRATAQNQFMTDLNESIEAKSLAEVKQLESKIPEVVETFRQQAETNVTLEFGSSVTPERLAELKGFAMEGVTQLDEFLSDKVDDAIYKLEKNKK